MKIKLVGSLAIVLGVFVFSAVASASDTDILQPASTITYNENLDVNGTIYTDSISIGQEGAGGVTYFNGSIVNVGATVPVTIADDLRVDGEIWRGSKGGDPIKISDNVIPTVTNTNDFGTDTNRWNNIYTKNADFTGEVDFSEANVTGLNQFFTRTESDSRYAYKTHDHIDEYYTKSVVDNGFVNVSGDTMAGALTVPTLSYSPAKTRYWTISGKTFIPSTGGCTYSSSYTDGYISPGTCSDVSAPVNLPDGAVVTGFRAYYYDDDGSDDFNVTLRAGDRGSASFTSFTMATINTSGASGYSYKDDNTITGNATISNQNFSYYVYANSFDGNTNHRLSGVVITYQITQPLP